MCSFGEINIPSSRAFWDDCDEDEPAADATKAESLKLVFEESGQGDAKIPKTDVFLLVEGVGILDFAKQSLVQEASKICSIPTEKPGSALYAVPSKKLLIAVLEEDLTHSGEIMQLLLPYAQQSKELLTLTIKRKVDYKSERAIDFKEVITFFRGINSKLEHVKELEAPNFIAGVGAGLAAWRENSDLSASSYVVYTDEAGLDALSTEPILKLLKQLGISCASSYNRKQKDDSWLYS